MFFSIEASKIDGFFHTPVFHSWLEIPTMNVDVFFLLEKMDLYCQVSLPEGMYIMHKSGIKTSRISFKLATLQGTNAYISSQPAFLSR